MPTSEQYKAKIEEGCLIERPGWIRMSIHPTITNEEVNYVCESIKELCLNFNEWKNDYNYNAVSNEFEFIGSDQYEKQLVEKWFEV